MEHRRAFVTGVLLVAVALLFNISHGIADEAKKKPPRGTGDVVAGELTAIANQLALKPGAPRSILHMLAANTVTALAWVRVAS